MKRNTYFSRDVSEFLRLLAQYRVHYLIVGGEAVIFYGHPRLTGDIDLFFDRSPQNARLLFKALREFWNNHIPGINDEKELRLKSTVVQFGIPPNRIDLLNDIEGVRFEAAWSRKVVRTIIVERKEVPIMYIGLGDLIRNKRAVNRNRDKDDLRFLESLKTQGLEVKSAPGNPNSNHSSKKLTAKSQGPKAPSSRQELSTRN